jgi:hypothetical protein
MEFPLACYSHCNRRSLLGNLCPELPLICQNPFESPEIWTLPAILNYRMLTLVFMGATVRANGAFILVGNYSIKLD